MINYYILKEEDYKKARELVFTSSEINRLMSEPTAKQKAKGQLLSDGAITYILEKVNNRCGEPELDFYNADMEWGNQCEPLAAERLCEILGYDSSAEDVIYGKDKKEGTTLFFNFMDEAGGSPDMILPNHCIEFKCPKTKTHLYYKFYLTAENFKEELPKYYDQLQFNMFLTKRDLGIFMSFDPRVKSYNGQSHIIVIKRDQDRINQIINKVNLAFEHMNQLIERL